MRLPFILTVISAIIMTLIVVMLFPSLNSNVNAIIVNNTDFSVNLSTPYDPIDIALKAGLVGVLASLSIFLAGMVIQNRNKKKESKERLARVCNALLIQVNDLDAWYSGKDYEELKKRYYEQNMTTMAPFERIINTAPYDAIVKSGLLGLYFVPNPVHRAISTLRFAIFTACPVSAIVCCFLVLYSRLNVRI